MSLTPKTLLSLERLLELPPHNGFLGLTLTSVEGEVITTELPFCDKLVGNIDTGAMHGGVLSSMIDSTSGLAVMVKLGRLIRVNTLDLRIDHVRPVTEKTTLWTRCECFQLEDDLAFVRGRSWQVDASNNEIEVAAASGSFHIVRARSGVMG